MKELIKRALLYLLVRFTGFDPEREIAALRKRLTFILEIPESVASILPDTRELINEYSGSSQSGEWKRHQVLSKLMKLGANESDAALAIEVALRKRTV